MNLYQSFIEALESLVSNKMRTGLTVLGVVIGVAAVIAMLAVGEGAQSSITGQIEGIGTNVVFISPGGDEDVRNPKPLTLSDAEALADPLAAPNVAAVAPILSGRNDVTYGGESSSVSILGVTPEYEMVSNEALTEGEFINETDILGRGSVAVIGPDTAEKLFDRTDGITGETIRINGQPFRVVGVLESKGGTGLGSQDDRILVPITTAQSRLMQRDPKDSVSSIHIQASSSEGVNAAVDEISEILRLRHRTEIGMDDFTIFTQQSILDTASAITGVFTIFLGGVAGISLLVGGIGIMNIMLVSVTERTREIGLRKALGARKRDILSQFLTESVVLSLLGGIMGIILAWILATVIGAVAAASGTPITPQISLGSILLATLFSMAVGLLFGLYPANRAASLQPVEALRFE